MTCLLHILYYKHENTKTNRKDVIVFFKNISMTSDNNRIYKTSGVINIYSTYCTDHYYLTLLGTALGHLDPSQLESQISP